MTLPVSAEAFVKIGRLADKMRKDFLKLPFTGLLIVRIF